jgi:hypothetical protein
METAANEPRMRVADYTYLKMWLSREDVEHIRNGNNPHGLIYTRRHVYNIMKGITNNIRFRNLLIKKAMENEALYSLQKTS